MSISINKEEQQKTIGVVGTGIMGKEITQFFAQMGYSVILKNRTEKELSEALKAIEKRLAKRTSIQEKEMILNRIRPVIDFTELANSELIIETVTENMDIKMRLLKELSDACPQDTIFASNTSSIPITKLAASVSNPERFIGMHFFNPVSRMSLVEVVLGKDTSAQTVKYAIDLLEKLGKVPIVVNDAPGFRVNRVLMPMINEATFLVRNGVTPKDIDTTIKLGLNHPMGPLELADFIGLDTCVSIMTTLHEELNDVKYIPSPILQEMVKNGDLGRKTGKGFYSYS